MTMRFRAHDTFYIRKGWLSKGMKNIVQKPNVFVDKNENPMDVLGIGANMVKALRYWLPAVGLTEEATSGVRTQQLTVFGELVYENDKFIEEIGTLYLLHYNLVQNQANATAWYWFFNKFEAKEFTKDDFLQQIQNYISLEDKDANVALRSLEDDFACIINTYVPNEKLEDADPENNIDCPFRELNLIHALNKKTFKKTIPLAQTFNPWVILAVIMKQADSRPEIRLNDLLTEPCSIGKVFNLDTITMLDILHNIEKIGELKIVRTAGLDIIHLHNQYTFEECVKKYYASIK